MTPEPAGKKAQPTPADPSNAGPGPTEVKSSNPKDDAPKLNPSAPEDANTTPGTTTPK